MAKLENYYLIVFFLFLDPKLKNYSLFTNLLFLALKLKKNITYLFIFLGNYYVSI